ncbi:MAG: RNA-binding domain-containing protein [Geobacteraceae bacterium]
MLNEQEILKLIANGENSYIEFKEDSADSKILAREIVAFSNHKGGYIFLGIDDSGNLAGLTRRDNEERVMNICSDLVRPIIDPSYYELAIGEKRIGVIEIERGCNKPYYLKDKSPKYYKRYGSTAREVKERDELQRLLQASGNLHYELLPASYSKLKDLDDFEIREFIRANRPTLEVDKLSEKEITNLYLNLDLIKEIIDDYQPTIAGLLLFGKGRVKRYLPQSGIMCVKVAGKEIVDEKENLKFFERNIFENYRDAVSFFYIYNAHAFEVTGIKRTDFFDYPEPAFRELLANALIHRDYTIFGTDIGLWIFDDRIEIRSPGGLPNTLTLENMKLGLKYHRNPVLAQYFFEAGMIERAGQGIIKCERWLKENGNPPLEIIEDENEVKVIMRKRKGTA